MTKATQSTEMTLEQKVEYHLAKFRSGEEFDITVKRVIKSHDLNEVRVVLKWGTYAFTVATISEGEYVPAYNEEHRSYDRAVQSAKASIYACYAD